MKNNITLNSINKEWDKETYSDVLNRGLPSVKKYYSKLTKDKSKEISNNTIEYLYLQKNKVYVAQTWNGNFAIGKNTALYKELRFKERKRSRSKKQKNKKKSVFSFFKKRR